MKRFFLCASLALLFATACCVAQSPPASADEVTTHVANFPIYTLNTAPVPGASLAISGNPGQQTYYYWAVANYQIGSVVSPLGFLSNAPNILSGSNFVFIAPFAYPPSVLTIDILRTTSALPPTDACNCAVATGLTSGSINDQSNSLSSYTVPVFSPALYNITLTNEVISPNTAHLIYRQNGVFVRDLALSGGGGGCTPLSSNPNAIVFLNGSSSCTSSADFVFTDSSVGFLQVGSSSGSSGAMRFWGPSGSARIGSMASVSDDSWTTGGSGLDVGLSSVGGNLALTSNAVNIQVLTPVSLVRASNVVTATFTGAPAIPGTGMYVQVNVPSDSTFNGRFQVTSVCPARNCTGTGNFTVTWNQTGAGASPSGGTVSIDVNGQGNGVSLSTTKSTGPVTILGASSAANSSASSLPGIQLLVSTSLGSSGAGGDILGIAGSTMRGGVGSSFASPGGNVIFSAGNTNTSCNTGLGCTTSPAGSVTFNGGTTFGGDNNGGNIVLNPGLGSGTGSNGSIFLNGPVVYGATSPTTFNAPVSTGGGITLTFNGAAVMGAHINQTVSNTVGGTCTMSSSTSCTFTLTSSYTTPVCILTLQSSTGIIAGGCTVSGTTVTVTAASSNSLTWGAFVFGNPT